MKIGTVLYVTDETAICHTNPVKFVGRAPKVEFRVQISFTDDEGHDWWIDKVYSAAPKLVKAKEV